MSLGELFPSAECTGKFLNFLPVIDSMNVVNNFGSVQSSLAQVLDGSTEQFWVNAEKDESSQSLYRYEGEAPHTYHLPPGSENQQAELSTSMSRIVPRVAGASHCMPYRTTSGIKSPLLGWFFMA